MGRFPHISTIIVVGGDSDYMPLSYKVKAAGRTLVGIGSRRGTNPHWARSCHEFKFYEALLAPPPVPAAEAAAEPATPAVVPDAAPAVVTPAVVPEAAADVVTPAAAPAAQAAPPAVPLDEMRALLDLAETAAAQRKAARELVGKAIARLAQNRGETWIQKARLRPFIKRMDPTFEELSYGFSTFNDMLGSMGDLVEVRRGEFDHELRLRPVATEPTA